MKQPINWQELTKDLGFSAIAHQYLANRKWDDLSQEIELGINSIYIGECPKVAN